MVDRLRPVDQHSATTMKVIARNLVVTFCCLVLSGFGSRETTAFSFQGLGTKVSTAGALSSTSSSSSSEAASSAELARTTFPLDLPLTRVEGGNTLRTYQIPIGAERAQIFLKTDGRPLKAKVELWVGPIRTVHTMIVDAENGQESPYRATLKFKPVGPTLKVSTDSTAEFPLWAGVQVPSPERSTEIGSFTEKIWDSSIKTRIQGGPVSGGLGAVKIFTIDPDVDSVQLVFWSRDTSKKSLKAIIEVLQGPNNKKQVYDLYCGGGTQPYHTVFETPGDGWTIRIINKKFVEDGLFEVAMVPYMINGQYVAETGLDANSKIIYPVEGSRSGPSPPAGFSNRKKEWWE